MLHSRPRLAANKESPGATPEPDHVIRVLASPVNPTHSTFFQ